MEKKLLGIVIVVFLCSSAAMALDPLGLPVAGLEQGQFSAGLDYAYSEIDLELDGKYSYYNYGWGYGDTVKDKFKIRATQMHKAYLNLGYGIMNNWEAFLRLGGATMYGKDGPRDTDYGYNWLNERVYDGDAGFSIGFGTKVTLWEDTKLKVGGLFQASWAQVDLDVDYEGVAYEWPTSTLVAWDVPTDGEMDFWEMQIAIGATYELSPKFTLYGGPFWYYFTGDYDFKGSGIYDVFDDGGPGWSYMDLKGSYDVENDSCFGGYLGTQIDVTDNVTCNAECQLTGDAVALGTNLTWRF